MTTYPDERDMKMWLDVARERDVLRLIQTKHEQVVKRFEARVTELELRVEFWKTGIRTSPYVSPAMFAEAEKMERFIHGGGRESGGQRDTASREDTRREPLSPWAELSEPAAANPAAPRTVRRWVNRHDGTGEHLEDVPAELLVAPRSAEPQRKEE